MPQAVIISIGTEMLTGARVDTNSAWLSDQLNILGYETRLHVTVADNKDDQVEIIRDVIPDCELILMTGGLGPTLDDLTREVLAEVMGVPLYTDEESIKTIREMFAKRGRTMPERNLSQARFPVGSLPLSNPVGTAPGIFVKIPQTAANKHECLIAAMPGVPVEMKKMFLEQVVPRVPHSGQVIRISTVECFGVGESQCEEMLGDLTARGRDPEVGITVHQASITLRIVARGETEEQCQQKIKNTKREITHKLNSIIIGEEGVTLEEVVIALLKEQKLKLAVCEIGQAGGLSSCMTRLHSLSHPVVGGLIAPLPGGFSDDGAEQQELLESYSKTLMAECVKSHQADIVLLTALPVHPDKKQAYIGLYHHKNQHSPEIYFQPSMLFHDESLNQSRTAKASMNMLRLYLLKLKNETS